MSRKIFPFERVLPAAAEKMSQRHAETIEEVERAIEKHPVVVVGMAQNPHVRRARKALESAGIDFEYLEYGSYLGEWQRRLSIKLWSGWPTFPQVFVKGQLVGGADQTQAALADGTIKSLLG